MIYQPYKALSISSCQLVSVVSCIIFSYCTDSVLFVLSFYFQWIRWSVLSATWPALLWQLLKSTSGSATVMSGPSRVTSVTKGRASTQMKRSPVDNSWTLSNSMCNQLFFDSVVMFKVIHQVSAISWNFFYLYSAIL